MEKLGDSSRWLNIARLETLRLRFFDIDAKIQSDSHAYIALFQRMYRRFQIDGSASSASRTAEFIVLTESSNPWGKPVMLVDNELRFLNTPQLLEAFVYENIFHAIIARVRSHFLVHAGVVSHNGQGIIIAADASHGKTTLVLELIRRGFKFLSDEMAAIGRIDRYVHPFPRSLRIRPGTLERVGLDAAAIGAPMWLDKLILDIDVIKPNSMGERVPIHSIVILRDPDETPEQSSNNPERELGILVDHQDDDLLAALVHIEGIVDIGSSSEHGDSKIKIRAVRPTRFLPQIEMLCHKHQVLILDVIKRSEGHPSFDSTVRLEAIGTRQATMALVRHFQGGHRSALLQDEFGGRSTELFMELADIVGSVPCYQLFVGPLQEMADLVERLICP